MVEQPVEEVGEDVGVSFHGVVDHGVQHALLIVFCSSTLLSGFAVWLAVCVAKLHNGMG